MTASLKMLVTLWLLSSFMSPAFAIICQDDDPIQEILVRAEESQPSSQETSAQLVKTQSRSPDTAPVISEDQAAAITRLHNGLLMQFQDLFEQTNSLSFDETQLQAIRAKLEKAFRESDLHSLGEASTKFLDSIWKNSLQAFREEKISEDLRIRITETDFSFEKAKELYLQYFETEESFEVFYVSATYQAITRKAYDDLLTEFQSLYAQTDSLSFDDSQLQAIRTRQLAIIRSRLEEAFKTSTPEDLDEDSIEILDAIWNQSLQAFRERAIAEQLQSKLTESNFSFEKAKELYLQFFETAEKFETFYRAQIDLKAGQLNEELLELARDTRYAPSASEIEGYDRETHGSSLEFLLHQENQRIESEVRAQFTQSVDQDDFDESKFKDSPHANPMIFLGGEIRFQDGRWQRSFIKSATRRRPQTGELVRYDVKDWRDIDEEEFERLKEEAIQKRIRFVTWHLNGDTGPQTQPDPDPSSFLRGEIRFQNGAWQRKVTRREVINSPTNINGRTREYETWEDYPTEEFNRLRNEAIQRQLEQVQTSTPIHEFIFSDVQTLNYLQNQFETLIANAPPSEAQDLEKFRASLLQRFEAHREAERLRLHLEDDHFRKENGRLDYATIEAHPGYTAMVAAIELENDPGAALPMGLAGLQSAHIIYRSNDTKEKIDNLSLVARRDRAYADFGGEKGFEQKVFTYLSLLSERQNRNGGELILKAEDVDIDKFLRANPDIDELRKLNESISQNPPRNDSFTKEGLRNFLFESFRLTQVRESQQIEAEIARLLENQSWRVNGNPLARPASPPAFAESSFDASQPPEDQLRDLMRRKQQRLDYLKQVLEPESYSRLEAVLSATNPALQATHRIHRPEFSGAISLAAFDSNRLQSIQDQLRDMGFYNPNETDPEKLKNQNQFIRDLQQMPSLFHRPASLSEIDKNFRELFSDPAKEEKDVEFGPPPSEIDKKSRELSSGLSKDEQDAEIEKLHNKSKQIFLNRIRATLYNLDYTYHVLQSRASQYRIAQQENLAYLETRKNEIYEILSQHVSEEELTNLKAEISLQVQAAIRGLSQQQGSFVMNESGGLSGFTRDVGRAFAESAVNTGEKLAMGIYGLGYTAAYAVRAAHAAMTDQQIEGFYDGLASRLEGIQRISNEHPLRGPYSSGSILNNIEDRSLWGLGTELGVGYGLFYYAPVFSVSAEPLFQSPELLTRNLIFRGQLGLSDQELHELRMSGDSDIRRIDTGTALAQGAIGLGMMLSGRPSQIARGRQILQNGVHTPRWMGRTQLFAPRTGPISDARALWTGRAATVGTSVGVAAGLSAVTVGSMEGYHADLEGRSFNVGRAIDQSVTSAGTSLLYMGVIRGVSGMLAARHFGRRIPKDPSQITSMAERTMYAESMRRAQAFAFRTDVVEGMGEMGEMVDMIAEAGSSGSFSRMMFSLMATGATLYDSFGEQLTTQGVRDGLFFIRRPFSRSGQTREEGLPIFVPQERENQAEYLRLREDRLSALYSQVSQARYDLKPDQIREILSATEETREALYGFQARDYQPGSAASFDITQVYEPSMLEQTRNQLLERYESAGLTRAQAQSIVDFALRNHLLDDYLTPPAKKEEDKESKAQD